MDDLKLKKALTSQYLAALEMLGSTITACPEELWDSPAEPNRTWRVTYHNLFFADLYGSECEAEFRPCVRHAGHAEDLGAHVPWPPHHAPKVGEPYTREELLAYLADLKRDLPARIAASRLDGESGFRWLKMSRYEAHLYSLRHLQHHTGQLADRLRRAAGIGTPWVGVGEPVEGEG